MVRYQLAGAFHRGEQEIAATKRWLKQPPPGEWLVTRIAAQVENELNHFASGEDGATLLNTGRGETCHCFRYRAHAEKRLLTDDKTFRLHWISRRGYEAILSYADGRGGVNLSEGAGLGRRSRIGTGQRSESEQQRCGGIHAREIRAIFLPSI